MNGDIGAKRNNVFLGERLDSVGHRLKEAERPNAVGTKTILHAGEALALEDRRQREEAGENTNNGDDAKQHACRGLQHSRQKAYEPIAQEDEDLVKLRGHGLGAPLFRWSGGWCCN